MTTLLILAVLVLGVMAVIRLSRVYELTAELRNKREELISDRDNRMNARLMWMFPFAYFGFFLWLTLHYRGAMLPVAASEHGVWLDNLYDFNWIILLIPFVITNVLLFYFAGKYYFRKDRWAYYYPHNNKWELAWTIVPSIVLIGIIIYGLNVWNRITTPGAPGTPEVELYAKQFDWTIRYPGPDGKLGATDFRLINDVNPLGIVTEESIAKRLEELLVDEEAGEKRMQAEKDFLPKDRFDELEKHVEHVRRMRGRIMNLRTLMEQDIAAKGDESQYKYGKDDIVSKEFHLPVNEDVELLIRSRDVIHSAYMPHMRAQMNAVPGVTTRIHLKPTITTDSMRTRAEVIKQVAEVNAIQKAQGKEPYEFNYLLLCNKVCGASHYNMQMPLLVEQEGAYKVWLAQQKGFQTAEAPPAPAAADSSKAAVSAVAPSAAAVNEPKKN